MKQDRQAYGRTIMNKKQVTAFDEPEIDKDKPNKSLKLAEKKNDLIGIPEIIANDKFCYLNWYFPKSQTMFPNHPQMRLVDKYYPRAEGGPLLVDEPVYPADIDACRVKSIALKAEGHRYLYLTPGMTVEEARKQLEEQ
jgi:hypothetical protein